MPLTNNSLPYPAETDSPDVPRDIQALAVALEKRIAGVYNSAADRDTKITSPQEGQVAYTKDTNVWYYYDGSVWQTLIPALPAFTSGSAAPSGGSNGDVYFKTS